MEAPVIRSKGSTALYLMGVFAACACAGISEASALEPGGAIARSGREPFSAALILGLGLAALALGALCRKGCPDRDNARALPGDDVPRTDPLDFNAGAK